MVDQYKLLDRLKGLLESQFKQLLLWLKVDESFLPSSEADRVTKAIALIKLLRQDEQGLQRLQTYLDRVHPIHPIAVSDCPYQGLAAFQEKHSEYFFGRETFTQDLVQRVHTNPLVAVVGASGSGKSSLVFAGLLPQLRNEGTWLIESFRPEKQPFYGLASTFVHQLEPELSKSDRIAKAIPLADTIKHYGFANVVPEILADRSSQRLLLVIDQFEELFTLCAQEERDRFIDVLLTGIKDSLGLKVVLTLRADFCGQAYAYRPLADALQAADLKLGPMNREELRQAIERPAQLMQVEFQSGLVERLLDDVRQEPGNLPLLEFALTQLWANQDERLLTYQAYLDIGGVAKALANHAEDVYTRLTEEEQQQAQRIFLQLVCPGEGTEDTRRLATRGEVGDENWNLVTRLAGSEARLVVTGRNDTTGEETVEIVHEALLREWQRLREWMESDRAFRVWQEGLRFARRQWQQSEHDEGALLEGFLLNEAEGWQNKRSADLSPEDHEFIRLSQEMRDRRTHQRLNELQELVEQKDKALQAETEAAEQAIKAAEQAEKAARAERVRTLAIALGSAAITISGGFAWWQQYKSEQTQQQSLQVIRDISLGIDSGTPELLKTLPTFLKQANEAQDRNRAMAYYRKIITEVDKLQAEFVRNPTRFPNLEQDKAAIAQLKNQAEKSLIDVINQTLLPELKRQLQTGLSNGSFGKKINDDWTVGVDQYEPGAVRTTYEIVIKSTGADINENGFLDNGVEADRIPGALIIEVEKAWREATRCECGWYGSNSLYISECPGLDGNSLFSLIFSKTTDFLVIYQVKQSGITESGYSGNAATSIRCSS